MPVRFQVDPDFYDHPKAIGMSDSATALWTRAGSYSVAKLLDGFVPEHALSLLSKMPDEAASELVGRGLWRRVKGGYRFHQWNERNPLTRARIEADRDADRQRKRRERAGKNGTLREISTGKLSTDPTEPKRAGQNTNPQVEPSIVHSDTGPDSPRNPNGIRHLSESVSESESESGSGHASPAVATARASPHQPEPPRTCPEHHGVTDPPACGRCAGARRTHNQWTADRNRQLRDAPQCRTHRGELAHNCRLCRADQLAQEDPHA